jgi:NAD+ kinase
VEAAGRASFVLVAEPEEVAKHADSASGVRSVDSLPAGPEFCLVLGGDGTILRALRAYAGSEVPVFGINFGTVGFLAAAEGSELEGALERAFAGDYEVMTLPALEIGAWSESGVALNDVSFTRRPHGRVAELSYRSSRRTP